MNNPFSFNRYNGPGYFCDREKETLQLLNNIRQQKHTAFFALRRLGKTALIHHVFHLAAAQRNQKCIYTDIYATQNLKEFTNQLAGSIYRLFPEKKGTGKKFWEFIKLFRPVVSVNELTGKPELSLDISQPRQVERSIPQLLQFLDEQPIKTCIAIDEFQQILSYPEKNTEALLRTAMQQVKNISFIFCGSNQTKMNELFNSARRPFFASCSNLAIGKIDRNEYRAFIRKHFNRLKCSITEEGIDHILDFTDTYTYYTQRLCHDLVIHNEKKINPETVQQVAANIIKEFENSYFQYRNLLTATQWHLLLAVAKEEKVAQPFGKIFLQTYRLGTAAIVKRSLEALLEKEMIYRNSAAEGSYYAVYDVFLMRWLQQK